MKSSRLAVAILVFAWVSFFAFPTVLAQTPEPAPGITITGQIVNGTPGGPSPSNVSLMLHAYEGRMMVDMIHGTSDAEGRFRFEDVPAPAGRSFEVMATYRDVVYFSERVEPEPGQMQLDLPVTVYETTTDTTAVRVEQLHILLDFSPERMHVVQIYVLSNTGDRAVVADGQEGLRFRLPAGATEVSFRGDQDGTRFVREEGGFVDTAPVAPGTGTLSTVVIYTIPYDEGIELTVPVDYPTMSAGVLVPQVGVTLSGEGWDAGQEMNIQGRPYLLHSFGHVPLAPGDVVRFTITGRPDLTSLTGATAETRGGAGVPSWVFALGLGFSLILITAGGIWWWRDRRSESAVASVEPDDLASVLQAIAELDDAHAAGTIDELTYRAERERLQALAIRHLRADDMVGDASETPGT
ncbi:MAG TPA: hypothetical protein G4O02_08655 [Caldilineae bacterium]|nr:hypothetical protein [Caldilineae bacterium]